MTGQDSRLTVIARNECKRCGVTVGNLHGVECVHSCERRVRLDQAERVEYVPASQLRGAVDALREIERYFVGGWPDPEDLPRIRNLALAGQGKADWPERGQ